MADGAIWSVPLAAGLAYAPQVIRAIIIGKNGKLDNTRPRDDSAVESLSPELRDLTTRLKNAHINQLEMLGFYAGGVAVAVAAGVPVESLTRLTGWYIKSRVAFVLAYAAPQVANGSLRSLSFIGALVSCILIYGEAAKAARNIM